MGRATVLGAVLAGAAAGGWATDGPGKLEVPARKRVVVQELVPVTENGVTRYLSRDKEVAAALKVALDPAKTAVVVCDMWDDHWCKAAAARCGDLARAAEPVLKACRDRGMTIVHCPSDCTDFYKDHPARKRMLAVKMVDPPKDRELPDPPLPIDDSDGGCDDGKPVKFFKAWTRQHAAITVDADKDYVTDKGAEVFSLMAEKGLTAVVVMGVHTNMCVLRRSFAIKQMVRWGKDVYLVRDLTDAMYNPKMRPFVTHERGTELVVEHIERHWCPTLESKALLGK
ncbi:MAG: isochorismatase [Isosphaera sp.]|nr:isochorismatase [Isosphaera sp.]